MSRVNRRTFLKQSLALAGAAFVVSTGAHRVLGANDRIRIGISGCGGRGGNHLSEYLGMKDVEVAYLVDIDTKRLQAARKHVEKALLDQLMKEAGLDGAKGAEKLTDEEKAAREKKIAELRKQAEPRLPKCVQDVRKALDDKNLDALSIATPNHWHTLQTIWAVQAGKDVYVEKPATHNVFEGRIAADLIAKSDRIVQTGTQNRSSAGWARIVEITRSGKLGKLLVSHGFASKTRGSIGFKPAADPPPEIDFDLWLGPAPKQPYHANLVHYNWHWFWDFGNGEIGNQGVHQTDVARWAVPGSTHPASVFSIGGRFGYKDQGQTPNTQLTVYMYGDTMVVFEVCGLVGGRKEEGKDESKVARVSNDFIFEAGKIVDNNKFYPKDSDKPAEMPKADVKLGPGNGPFGNFVAAMRSRRKPDLNAPFLEGHYSAALCHLGNISWRLGKDAEWPKGSKPFGANDYANAQWARLEEHLVKNRGLKLEEMPCRLGRPLKFDPVKEKFIDDPEADKMLTREPRKPFDVPEKA